jgi:hypothetical protein
LSPTDGISGFGLHPVPNEDLLKQIRLGNIKTRAGRVAYLVLLGKNADVGRVANGVREASGALKWISKVLRERTKEENPQ